MPQLPTADEFLAALNSTVLPIIQKDGAAISAFGKRQLEALRDQVILVAEGVAAGDYKGRQKLLDHHLHMLNVLAQNFALTCAGLAVITIERVWNALVGVIWDMLDRAAGFALPRPS